MTLDGGGGRHLRADEVAARAAALASLNVAVRGRGNTLARRRHVWPERRFQYTARLAGRPVAVQRGEQGRLCIRLPRRVSEAEAALPDAAAERYVELSMQIVSRQLALPIGNQTRIGWEDTLKTLSSLRLLARAVSAEEVAIYD